MNKVLLSLFFGAFILTSQSFAQTPAPAEAPAPVAVPVEAAPVHHHHHPEITKAIHDLKLAKSHLENAASDYGGHKATAIQSIDAAIAELQAALEYVRTH